MQTDYRVKLNIKRQALCFKLRQIIKSINNQLKSMCYNVRVPTAKKRMLLCVIGK